MRERHKTGSLVFDKGRGTWRFLQWVDGKRKSQTIGNKQEFPTKAAAWKAVKPPLPEDQTAVSTAPTVKTLVEQYWAEKMPARFSTRHGCNAWLKNHIVPKWASVRSQPCNRVPLNCGSSRRAHIRGLLSIALGLRSLAR